jgi:ABC-type transporter Mla subunit MlaD
MFDIGVLKDLAKAIEAGSKALQAFVETMKDVVASGARAYDAVAARRTRADLLMLTRSLTRFAAESNIRVVASIDEYLAKPDPTEDDWRAVTRELSGALERLRELMARVEAEQSAFVATRAYREVLETLVQRRLLLEKLAASPPPEGEAAMAELRRVNRRYKRLMKDLRAAIDALNDHLGESFLNAQPTRVVADYAGVGGGWPETEPDRP